MKGSLCLFKRKVFVGFATWPRSDVLQLNWALFKLMFAVPEFDSPVHILNPMFCEPRDRSSSQNKLVIKGTADNGNLIDRSELPTQFPVYRKGRRIFRFPELIKHLLS